MQNTHDVTLPHDLNGLIGITVCPWFVPWFVPDVVAMFFLRSFV